MSSRITLIAIALFVLSSEAYGQVQAYRHRSTVLGDHLAGAAEFIIADGLNARDHAEAYRTRVEADKERYLLEQIQLEGHYRELDRREQMRAIKRENNLRARAARESRSQTEALNLVARVKSGVHQWPSLFDEPLYAPVVNTAERLLATWPVGYDSGSSGQRAALASLATQLRGMIQKNQTQSTFAERSEAMQTVKLLEMLPELTLASDARLAIR